MALKVADLVKETTSVSDGTSNYDLTAITGYQQFGDVLSDADTTYYAISDEEGKWEVGIGTYDATNDELDRSDSNVIASSNSNNRVVWGSGDKEIYITQPAGKAVYQDDAGSTKIRACLSSFSADTTAAAGDSNTLYEMTGSTARTLTFTETNCEPGDVYTVYNNASADVDCTLAFTDFDNVRFPESGTDQDSVTLSRYGIATVTVVSTTAGSSLVVVSGAGIV